MITYFENGKLLIEYFRFIQFGNITIFFFIVRNVGIIIEFVVNVNFEYARKRFLQSRFDFQSFLLLSFVRKRNFILFCCPFLLHFFFDYFYYTNKSYASGVTDFLYVLLI